ncbi:class I SAM-dependent methyltransferase [Methylogaea oryzae]|uniref:Methyltransferase type 11 domain-containing protein n=1 Tax=Methylogaea oryzae TaxID=1295382 RepID=A0A8D5AH58_9GAMM|nr:class I SAM-dependent methyltransferase [Methylogaea oryzae]BBL69926.1 hypothetical protein MoryE10_05320 [Methylogaea oryzae]
MFQNNLAYKAVAPFLVDPKTKEPLKLEADGFVSKSGAYEILRNIPRFVSSDNYVRSFSLEWNTHNQTQLDIFRNDKSSESQFVQKTGFTPEKLKGALVLDAGVGAGRYCDIASRWGANVVGVDLSFAVESSSVTFQDRSNVWIAQADIGNLPFAPGTFDYIFSIGVLHHTPDTKLYFQRLVPLLKPGGRISIWVYPNTPDYVVRAAWIPFVNKIPSRWYYSWCRWFVPFAARNKNNPYIRWISKAFPFSDQGLGIENDILDTYDGYSPTYHGVHSPEEVMGWFQESGLVDISQPSDWLTCVTGVKPA